MEANNIIRDQHLAGATLLWGHPELHTSINASQFDHCDITIMCPARGISLYESVFRSCTIRVKRPFADYQFFVTGFERCRFIGQFPGCEFGFRDGVGVKNKMRGYARACDFSAATLDLVALNGVDVSTLVLPPWPHFVVKTIDAFAAVTEFADDPEWTIGSKLPWAEERAALIMLYKETGRNRFRAPAKDALGILGLYPDLVTVNSER